MIDNSVKLTYENIITMRALRIHRPSVYTGRKLAALFNVSKANAEKVLRGDIWRHIPFPIQPYASEIASKFLTKRLTMENE